MNVGYPGGLFKAPDIYIAVAYGDIPSDRL